MADCHWRLERMVALHAQKDGLRMVVILMPTKMNFFHAHLRANMWVSYAKLCVFYLLLGCNVHVYEGFTPM